MKIGFDAKRFFFNHSGLGNYSRSVIGSLLKYFPENQYFLYVDRQPTIENAHPEALSLLQNNSSQLALRIGNSMPWWRIWGMGAMAGKDNLDVFHGLSNELPRDLPFKIKGVATVHDVIFKEYPSYYHVWDRWIYQWKTDFAVRRSNQIIMTSEYTQQQVKRYFANSKDKSTVVYQSAHESFTELVPRGMDQQEHLVYWKQTPSFWVYQSSFTERKNHATLIEAFSKIHKQTDWKLVLVGLSGPTLEPLRKRVEALGLSNRIEFKVDVPLSEMVDIVQSASGFVYPTLSEGFGIPLAEALACNLPMAVSNIPIFRELGNDSPVYFHPNKADEMAAAMLKITNPEEHARQRLLRDKLLERMTAFNTAKQLVKVYDGMLTRN